MSLKNKEINPLNVLSARQLDWIPNHFEKIYINQKLDIKLLEQWISFNLNSRYAIKHCYRLSDIDKKIDISTVIGLEDPKEITILSLSCPYL